MFPEQSNQDLVFENVGKRTVQEVIEGFNGTIFACKFLPPRPSCGREFERPEWFPVCAGVDGQTGSGKTYTMQGEADSGGITPRAVNLLFELMEPEFDFTFEVRSTDTFRRLPTCRRILG